MSNLNVLNKLKSSVFATALVFALALQNDVQAQEKMTEKKQSVTYMTWNKNTPETEMQDDIKALKKQGVDIKYSDVKRNAKGEITSIKVDFKDDEGNSGNIAYNGKNPISQIQFHKTPESVGFGQEDRNFNGMASNFGWINDDMNRNFNFNFNDMPMQRFEFETEKDFDSKGEKGEKGFKGSKSFGKSNSKIIIQKNGKKPLVIENGEVVEGGEGYTKEEIEEIKKNNKFEFYNGNGNNFQFNMNPNDFFNGNGMEGFKEQFDRLQKEMDKMRPQLMEIEKNKKELNNDSENVEQTKKELEKAREEMQKAREEMNKAREEMQKTKTEMKIRKA